MKKTAKLAVLLLALALALALGVTALAETAPGPDADAAAADSQAGDTALQDALNALAAARSSSRLTDLETELKAYVAAGTLTQEQADLILKAWQDQEALHSGVCPNCGYQFSSGFGKGGRMKNGSQSSMPDQNRNGAGFGRGGHGGRGGFGLQQNGNAPFAPQNPDPSDVSGT